MGIKLHDLPADPGKGQHRRRIGRGNSSGWGRNAGRGEKGAKSRSGYNKTAAFEGGQTPLVRRVPKYGFSNISFRVPRAEITLGALNRFDEGSTVDLPTLQAANLVAKHVRRVKVIATGKLEKKLTIKLQGFTAGARAAIEGKGGSCEAVKS